ncbi:hypothetical protein N9392_00405 [Flavobacteriaceae bacterium]|nr:hypothetical protein [Flavobacteriaceae bacterium]
MFIAKYRSLTKTLFFDKNEKKYLSRKKSVVLVQIVRGYYEFSLLEKVLKKEVITSDIQIIGIESKVVYFKISDYILFFPYLLKTIVNEIRRRKWRKIYGTIGVGSFVRDNKSLLYWRSKDLTRLIKLFFGTKLKRHVFDLDFNSIYLGDLIYDGYLRYYNQPTIALLNFNFLSLLSHSIGLTRKVEHIISKFNVKLYIAQYSNYVNSGIPCRVITKNNIRTLAVGNDLNIVKELDAKDYKRAPNHKLYKHRFDKIEDKKEKIDKGIQKLKARFSGKIDIIGMRNSSFSEGSNPIDPNIEGVVFLHDLFDAQHMYEEFCFNDLYEWTLFNLKLIREENLNIGVKPHINQRPESSIIINKLKEEYNDIYWIDPKVSNIEIFKSISFGCTVFGTVISELAYHNILPISCGDNPTSSFDFHYQAKSPEEYKKIILNYRKYTSKYNPSEEEIGAFVYMHYESNKSVKYKNIIIDRINSDSQILESL